MKILKVTIGLTLISTAIAQTWDVQDGTLTLVGCYGKQDGVYCDFSYTLTKKQTARLYWVWNTFKVYGQNGVSQGAAGVSFVDGKFGTNSSEQEIISNVPVKVQVRFDAPSSTSSFRALAFNNVKFDNVSVRPYYSTSKTSAQLSAVPNLTGFAVSFSNCQLQGQNYVCVATLTPAK